MKANAAQLSALEPIRGLSPERRKELAGICSVEHTPLGGDPLRGLDLGTQSVYLLKGELKLYLAGGGGCLLVGGCDDANWPLGHKGALPTAGKAITPLEWMRVDNTLLDILMTWDQLSSAVPLQPSAPASDERDWRQRSGVFHARNLACGALACLPPANIHELMRRLERIERRRGEVIVREGEAGEHYYVVESGRCEVVRSVGGVDMLVAELKAGDAFGEESLLSGEARNATVRMKTDGYLWRLAKPDFVELLQAPLLHVLSRAEAEKRVLSGRAVWVDVRYPAEYARDGLAGAINIPLHEIRSAFSVLDRGREYVVYCQSGRRSSAAAFLLAQHGLRAAWLEGGLEKSGVSH